MPQKHDSYQKLIRGYAIFMRRVGHVETAAAALRTQSSTLRDVMALIASNNQFTTEQLRDAVNHGWFDEIKFRNRWLAAFGRVCALQSFQDTDVERREADIELGLACLSSANRHLPTDNVHQQFHRLEIELLTRSGELEAARDLIQDNDFLRSFYHSYLLSDLQNPSISKSIATYNDWLEGFNRPFRTNGLLTIEPHGSWGSTFDSLGAPPATAREGGPRVSVIMTSYMPDPIAFPLAVRSILEQSWQNLELIIIDDASSEDYHEVLLQVGKMDPRVRIIRLSENGGTYRARNVGIKVATGDLITGQDSDDWSHPERLEHQVDYLLKNPQSTGVVVEAIRMDDNLVRMFPGRIPHRQCEVSLMLPAHLAREVGGYVDARKGADSEFRRRIERYTYQEIACIDIPLYLIRIGHDSLSRADFKPGWSHPVRRAFWNASQHWHETTETRQLRLVEDRQPIPVPNKFKISVPHENSELDAVFLDDWRSYGGRQRALIDEIKTLRESGQRVGVMHFESILSPSKETTRLSYEVQELINNGDIVEVISDEGVSSEMLVIGDPSILHFLPNRGIKFTAQHVLIAPEYAPWYKETQGILYLPSQCDKRSKELFGGKVVWTSRDPSVRIALEAFGDAINVAPEPLPITLRPHRWNSSREKFQSEFPVIGRHAENHQFMWPNKYECAETLWPVGNNIEIRVLGDARAYLRKYDKRQFPTSWVVFRDNEIQPEAFMSSLDFFVYFPAEGSNQSYCREALEAVVSGAIAILPKSFQAVHGDLAIYSTPDQVPLVVERLAKNWNEYLSEVKRSQGLLSKQFSGREYLNYIRRLNLTKAEMKELNPEKHAFS